MTIAERESKKFNSPQIFAENLTTRYGCAQRITTLVHRLPLIRSFRHDYILCRLFVYRDLAKKGAPKLRQLKPSRNIPRNLFTRYERARSAPTLGSKLSPFYSQDWANWQPRQCQAVYSLCCGINSGLHCTVNFVLHYTMHLVLHYIQLGTAPCTWFRCTIYLVAHWTVNLVLHYNMHLVQHCNQEISSPGVYT